MSTVRFDYAQAWSLLGQLKDLPLDQLAISAQTPLGVTYGKVKLDPVWDPLRGDPRFDKIVADLAPN